MLTSMDVTTRKLITVPNVNSISRSCTCRLFGWKLDKLGKVREKHEKTVIIKSLFDAADFEVNTDLVLIIWVKHQSYLVIRSQPQCFVKGFIEY